MYARICRGRLVPRSAKWGRLVRRFWPVFGRLSSSEKGQFYRPPRHDPRGGKPHPLANRGLESIRVDRDLAVEDGGNEAASLHPLDLGLEACAT